MSYNCKNCKFHDADYGLDDKADDEVEIEVCRKGHSLLLHLPFKCPYFKKCKPRTYIERFTECDKCEYLTQCKSEGCVINCMTTIDSYEHFTRGINAYCKKKSEPFEGKKLSEIIETVYKSNDPELKNGKEFFQKAIGRFGDITYREFIKEKVYEMHED